MRRLRCIRFSCRPPIPTPKPRACGLAKIRDRQKPLDSILRCHSAAQYSGLSHNGPRPSSLHIQGQSQTERWKCPCRDYGLGSALRASAENGMLVPYVALLARRQAAVSLPPACMHKGSASRAKLALIKADVVLLDRESRIEGHLTMVAL